MDSTQLPAPPEGWRTGLGGLNVASGRALFAITIIFLILTWIAIGMRIWAKIVRKRAFQLHDYFVFVALPFATAFAIIFCVGIVHGGIGLQISDSMSLLGPEGVIVLQKVYYSGSIVWVLATTLAKLSILDFCRRIFERRWFRYAAYATSALVVLFGIIFFFVTTFLCTPIAFLWDPSLNGCCLNLLAVQVSTAAVNAVLDFGIAVLPMNILWGLQMPTKKKVAVTLLISLGPVITILNIIRIILEVRLEQTNATHLFGILGMLAGLEIYLGIISACLPTFGALIFDREKRSGGKLGLFSWRSSWRSSRRRSGRSGSSPLVRSPGASNGSSVASPKRSVSSQGSTLIASPTSASVPVGKPVVTYNSGPSNSTWWKFRPSSSRSAQYSSHARDARASNSASNGASANTGLGISAPTVPWTPLTPTVPGHFGIITNSGLTAGPHATMRSQTEATPSAGQRSGSRAAQASRPYTHTTSSRTAAFSDVQSAHQTTSQTALKHQAVTYPIRALSPATAPAALAPSASLSHLPALAVLRVPSAPTPPPAYTLTAPPGTRSLAVPQMPSRTRNPGHSHARDQSDRDLASVNAGQDCNGMFGNGGWRSGEAKSEARGNARGLRPGTRSGPDFGHGFGSGVGSEASDDGFENLKNVVAVRVDLSVTRDRAGGGKQFDWV